MWVFECSWDVTLPVVVLIRAVQVRRTYRNFGGKRQTFPTIDRAPYKHEKKTEETTQHRCIILQNISF